MSTMKLCKDCKHIMSVMGSVAMCYHPNAPVDPVYGQKDASCSLMRSANCLIEHCGPEAIWFEPSESQTP